VAPAHPARAPQEGKQGVVERKGAANVMNKKKQFKKKEISL
jgi:hypothetical protein